MPRFGEPSPTPADVWAAATRELTGIAMAELFDLPIFDNVNGAAPVAVTSAAGSGLYGDWAEYTADVGVGRRLISVGLAQFTIGTSFGVQLEIGEGAGGSEVTVAQCNVPMQLPRYTSWYVPLWKSLTDNARISLRIRDVAAATLSYYITPLTVPM